LRQVFAVKWLVGLRLSGFNPLTNVVDPMILRKHTGLRFWNSNLVYLSINIGYASHQILGFYMDFITMLRSRKTRPMRLTNTQISDGFFNAARLHRPVSSEQKVAVKALQSSILSTS
jgi:hypothetical protein